MNAFFLAAALAVLPTPQFCDEYVNAFRAAVCSDVSQGNAYAFTGCVINFDDPACPAEGGTLQEASARGASDGHQESRRRGKR